MNWHITWLMKALEVYKQNNSVVNGSMTIDEFIKLAIPEEIDAIIKLD